LPWLSWAFQECLYSKRKRSEMDPYLLKMALIAVVVLGCIGLVFGIGLAMAAQKFAVKVNPKVEEVVEVLAGAQ
jgi:electron transport complex protein RnfB